MKRVVFAAVAVCLAAAPAFAASPKVDAAVKTFKGVSADPGKLKTFCEYLKAQDAAGEKPTPAAEAKMDGYLKQLGKEFTDAWGLGETMNETSADGKVFNAAVEELYGKCG
jgi:hypothetical protein